MEFAGSSGLCEKCRYGVPHVVYPTESISVSDVLEPGHEDYAVMMLRAQRGGGFNFDHYPTFSLLEESAFSGCPVCLILRQALIFASPSLPDDDGPVRLRRCWERSKRFLVELGPLTSPIASNGVRVIGNGQPYQHKPVPLKHNYERSVRQIKQWLLDCVEHHELCVAPNSLKSETNQLIPTRLLEISQPGTAFQLRLIITSDHDLKENTAYLILSYCWGGQATKFPTTSSNLGSQLQGIDPDSLPATIRSAIRIARDLNISYLWIDSLCIIQPTDGDYSDWLVEAPRMGQYYSNALFTIAATGASSSSHDFLTDGPGTSLPVEPCTVTSARDGILETYTLLPTPPAWKFSVDQGPLYRRGWTLQERVMSRRIVHFTRDAVFWECSEHSAMEAVQSNGHLMSNADIWNPRPKDYLVSTGRRLGPRYLREEHAKVFSLDEWMVLVEHFSRMDFTYLTDKLVAISGIAEALSHKGADGYCAGIWRNTLPQGLAWFSCRHRTTYSQKPYIAPSWSWASVHAQILQFDTIRNHTDPVWMDCVISIDVDYTSPSLFGQVSGGRLSLRGRLQEIDLILSRVGADDSNKFIWTNKEEADDDVDSVESFSTQPVPDYSLVPEHEGAIIFFDDIPQVTEGTAQNLIFLPLYEFGLHSYGCLVLQKINDDRKLYRRIGIGELDSSRWFQHAVEVIVDII